jgi:broad specificity phosphatase PhoE
MSHDQRLILVKHSLPAIDPAVPAPAWRLGDEGRRRCESLARRLMAFRPSAIVASDEPKAAETAAIVAARLTLPWRSAPDLHEHARWTVLFEPDRRAFESTVARFFREPDAPVFGEETATAAGDRFSAAIDSVLRDQADGSLVVMTHGTVIALFVARHNDVDAFALWRRLDLPSFVVLNPRTLRLIEIVESMV